MANVLKENGGAGTPILILPTGEQQITVSILKIVLFNSLFSYKSRLLAEFDR